MADLEEEIPYLDNSTSSQKWLGCCGKKVALFKTL